MRYFSFQPIVPEWQQRETINVLDALDLSLSELDREQPLSILVAIQLETYLQLRTCLLYTSDAADE